MSGELFDHRCNLFCNILAVVACFLGKGEMMIDIFNSYRVFTVDDAAEAGI